MSTQHGEEFLLGYAPHRDGSDWDASAPTPSWSEVLSTVLEEDMEQFTIVVLGKLGSDEKISGISCNSTWRSAVRVVGERGVNVDTRGDILDHVEQIEYVMEGHAARDPENTSSFVHDLFSMAGAGLHAPIQKIVGIVLRKL